MSGPRSEDPESRFRPAEPEGEAKRLALARAPGPGAGRGAGAAGEPEPVPEPPAGRAPAVYQKPSRGAGNLLVFPLAAVGLVAIVAVGARLLKGGYDQAAGPAGGAGAAPEKAVEWRALDKDDAVLVTVEVTPKIAGARLLLDGEPLPSNPARLPRGKAPRKIAVLADGYEPAAELVVPDAPKTLKLTLTRAK